MKSKDLTSLAVGLAAGTYTHEKVLDLLGGDNELMDKVLGIAAGFGVGSIAQNLTSKIIDNTPIKDVCESVDEVVSDIFGGLF